MAANAGAEQWFQVDFGREVKLDGVVIDSTGSPNQYTPDCKVYLSDDGARWKRRGPLVRESPEPVRVIRFPGRVAARCVRIVISAQSEEHAWSIHEFSLYYR